MLRTEAEGVGVMSHLTFFIDERGAVGVPQVEETRRMQFASFAEALELSLYDFQGAMVSSWSRPIVVMLPFNPQYYLRSVIPPLIDPSHPLPLQGEASHAFQ